MTTTMRIGSAVRDTITGWPGKVVTPPRGRQPRGTLHVLFDGTATPICVDKGSLTYVARHYATAKAWEAREHDIEPQSVGGACHA